MQPFQPGLLTCILHSFSDEHSACAARAVPSAVEICVTPAVHENTGLKGLLAQVRTKRNLDGLFFIDKLDLGHGYLFRKVPIKIEGCVLRWRSNLAKRRRAKRAASPTL